MSDNQYQWVILRLRYATNELWLNYEDSRGNKRSAPLLPQEFSEGWSFQFVAVPSGAQLLNKTSLGIKVPLDFHQLILDLLQELPMNQTGPHATGPVPLAIFIEAPPLSDDAVWEEVITELLPPEVDHNRIEYVRKTSGDHRHVVGQRPFSLPLRILTVGDACQAAVGSLLDASWYKHDPSVQKYGINLGNTPTTDVHGQLGWDIVLTDADSVTQAVLETENLSAHPARPRLVIFAGSTSSEPYVNNLDIPAGSAFLWIPQWESQGIASASTEFLTRFFYGIIHDYPLHEALKSAGRGSEMALPRTPLLIADPVSNNAFRFSDALPQIVAGAQRFRKWKRLGDIGQFIARAGDDVSEPLRQRLMHLDGSRKEILSALKLVRETPQRVVFDQETEGLVHMASAADALETAFTEHANINAVAAAIVAEPGLAEELEKHQERHVDIEIFEADAQSQFQPLCRKSPLRPKNAYRVSVKIGHRSPNSVMVGDVPPLDPLLPPTNDEGYELEVALFEKDFEALSTTWHKLFLPRLGGSEAVSFDIRAPKLRGVAEARIGIYYQNNLLQSFLLKANVNPESGQALDNIKLKVFVAVEDDDNPVGGIWVDEETDRQVLTALAFTQSARLGNLNQFTRRELSIGFNENVNPSGHTFMLKADGMPAGINIKDDILKQQTETFRELLKTNVIDANKKPVFPTYPGSGDETNAVFIELVRKLIERGNNLYNFIYTNVPPEMKKKLGELQVSSDKTVQIVRFDMNNVFPWPIIYDYVLPTKIENAPAPQICLGYTKPATPDPNGDYPVQKCTHGPFDEVYCLSGFWGLRLQIEQLFKLSTQKTDGINELHPTSPQSVVQLAVSTGDAHGKKLSDALASKVGAGISESPSAQDLIDLLWDDAKRPAVLVVMGHLQKVPVPNEPVEDRIVLVPQKEWFRAKPILTRLMKEQGQPWKQPNTLVMLMACSSGATEITTLDSFVTNLNSAGAAAVVGTECLVFSSLVGRFAEEVTLDLWNGKKLGEAIKFFNRRLVSNGNPLAFVFNCLGNADLKLVKPH